jgi:hypothetical protein
MRWELGKNKNRIKADELNEEESQSDRRVEIFSYHYL